VEEIECVFARSVRCLVCHRYLSLFRTCVLPLAFFLYSHCATLVTFYIVFSSLVQIKSHAQKVLKRLDEGENIFRRLEENQMRLDKLVADLHHQLGIDPSSLEQSAVSQKKRRRTVTHNKASSSLLVTSSSQPPTSSSILGTVKGSEHILAASALCQLAAPKRIKMTLDDMYRQDSYTHAVNTTNPQSLTWLHTDDRLTDSPSSTLWRGPTPSSMTALDAVLPENKNATEYLEQRMISP
jgi:hypothetical protein